MRYLILDHFFVHIEDVVHESVSVSIRKQIE